MGYCKYFEKFFSTASAVLMIEVSLQSSERAQNFGRKNMNVEEADETMNIFAAEIL